MSGSIIIIALIIGFWCCFDKTTAPGITAPRPYGIAALVGLGAVIVFTDVPSPYLIATESFLASMVILLLVGCILALATGDHPSESQRQGTRAIFATLLLVVCTFTYLLGGLPALYGALLAEVIIGIGVAVVTF